MTETTESELQGATVVSVYKSFFEGHFVTVTLELPDGKQISLIASSDGYGASWIEID